MAVLLTVTSCRVASAQKSLVETPSLGELDPEVVEFVARMVRNSAGIAALWPGFWSPPEFIVHRGREVALLYSPRGARPEFARVRPDSQYRSISPHTYVLLGRRPRRVRRLVRGEPFVPFALNLGAPRDPSVHVLSPVDVLVHESFHHWQVNAFSERPRCLPQWYPRSMVFSPEFREAVQKELAQLQVAIRSTPGREMRRAAVEYLLARKQRLSAVDPLAFHIEQWQERAEGTARYVGNAAHLVVERSSLDLLPQVLATALDSLISRAGNPSVTAEGEQAGRSYGAGAAIAFLISQVAPPGWQSVVQEGRPLDEVLAEAVGAQDYLSWMTSLPKVAEVCEYLRASESAHPTGIGPNGG